MPRAQRSRACQQCRDRRVKCDETAGFCQQCRRLGLTCSGPLQGSVIIDMTDRVTRPRQRKKRDTRALVIKREDEQQSANDDVLGEEPAPAGTIPTPPTSTALQPVEPPYRDSSVGHWLDPQAGVAPRSHYRLPMRYQPSRAVPDALDLMFVSHFVERMTSVRMDDRMEIPWITHLPDMHQKAIKPALRLSIRATSMAFYATLHRDTTILVDSFKWYTMSLHSQRQSLAKMGSHTIPASEDMIVPIILSLYEVYAGTTTTSMWHHLAAATKILELRGPSNCKGMAFPLFKAMRVSEAHRAMVFNTPSPFSAHEWMTVPFEEQSSNAHQHLADILFLIPNHISILNMGGSMRTFFATPIPPHANVHPVETYTRDLLQDIDNWALRYPHLTVLPTTTSKHILTASMDRILTEKDRETWPAGSTIVIPASFVALTAATYEATRLILLMLLIKVSNLLPSPASSTTWPETDNLFGTATRCSKHILTIAAHMEKNHPVGFDFIRTVFPLVVVGILGPRTEEREVAEAMLDRWGKMKGMAGLCSAWLQA